MLRERDAIDDVVSGNKKSDEESLASRLWCSSCIEEIKSSSIAISNLPLASP